MYKVLKHKYKAIVLLIKPFVLLIKPFVLNVLVSIIVLVLRSLLRNGDFFNLPTEFINHTEKYCKV